MQLSGKVDRHQKISLSFSLHTVYHAYEETLTHHLGNRDKAGILSVVKCKTKGTASSRGRQVELPLRPTSRGI